ncbi:MAG: RNA-binding S4 domain-containing protein [Prolixibacteraceae bacterium]|jgi:ribosome-associated heat shock protein Hsp15|nr:RNA-binding S4 domain-containing protein [Prolixibacteraceae bacterium]
MADTIRIDKWMWAVRLFKTRSIAAEACKKGLVSINDTVAKPSREIKVGDKILIKRNPVVYHFKVLALTGKRMGAKLVPDFMEDITPPENLEILEMQKYMKWSDRDRGTGRPTKKDRREMDEFRDF